MVPLYDRLTSYQVELEPLNEERAKLLIENYLNLARDKKMESISPFSEEFIQEALKSSKGNYRSFIRFAHKAIEYAVQNQLNPPLSGDLMEKMRDVVYDETSDIKV